MKKVILVLVLVGFLAGAVSAQEKEQQWWNSYSPAVDESKMILNAGAGFGWGFGATVSVDFFKLPVPVPIMLGAVGSFNTSGGWSRIGVGGRATYHFNFSALSDADFFQKSDIYFGLTLGYAIGLGDATGFFLYGGTTGLRYYFTDIIGVYVELGYSGLQYASAGVTVKF